MVDINKLKGKIVEKGINVTDLAKRISIDRATFYRKLNTNGESFTILEADKIAKELELTLNEVNLIFFSQFVA